MDKTTKADVFRKVFQNSLKINARSISVNTLLSERNLKRIDYSPYYQRNYVWDREKQTFFIESVILGTEVPPLILFKSGSKIEVIDGRQRFETLKKFKENDFTLTHKGLKELSVLAKSSFNKLSEENKGTFLSSNIRIFEFEVVNQPDLTDDIIDRVKKEIFRRYNTGITPLTRNEVDNAKYDSDQFSEFFRQDLKRDFSFFKKFNQCFSPTTIPKEQSGSDGIISKNVDFVRRLRIINQFPISTYAGSSRRGEIIDLLYDFSNSNSEDITEDYNTIKSVVDLTISLYEKLNIVSNLDNKLIYECLAWAILVIRKEESALDCSSDEVILRIKDYFLGNLENFQLENNHYYANIISRYMKTAECFSKLSDVDFDEYIRDPDFSRRVKEIGQTEEDSVQSIESYSSLRLHKPNPTSVPIDEIRSDLRSHKYLLRPSYQRQEKINQLKASSIIESILLGINLPPIFIYKRKDGIKEVVDGQQRLLSIIGFLGEQFYDESGNLTRSRNNNFRLKGLRVLTALEGKRYSELTENLQDRLIDFVLDQIIIDEEMNRNFDPIDLFIRLNYKPYPIKPNSFEMWNSIVDQDVIKKIKSVAKSDKSSWFFIREVQEGKADRMLNEEMITTLSYLTYKFPSEDVIGFFLRQDSITCRVKNKKALSDFLIDLDNTAIEKSEFLTAIGRTEEIIYSLSLLFSKELDKDEFNNFLNVKKNKTYRRSLQDFYVIWLVLNGVFPHRVASNSPEITKDINDLLCLLKNSAGKVLTEKDFLFFEDELKRVRMKWKLKC